MGVKSKARTERLKEAKTGVPPVPTAHLMNARIAPRKVKILCDIIRGKDVMLAMAIISHTPKAASELLSKLLKSAMANAENNYHMDVENLYISQVFVTPGPVMKRIHPRAQGRAFKILKRTSHVTIVLKEKE